MPSTTNFGWTTPADTDLVKDGASAIRTLGNGIDTSFVDLKGGTTGQVLSKNSNTDLDFTWVAQDDSNAIQNAIVDAKGDLISATAADTPARLAVGTNGQVLTADSTQSTGLAWTTISSGGMTLITTTTFDNTASTYTYSSLGSYKHLMIVIENLSRATTSSIDTLYLQFNSVTTGTPYESKATGGGGSTFQVGSGNQANYMYFGYRSIAHGNTVTRERGIITGWIYDYAGAGRKQFSSVSRCYNEGNDVNYQFFASGFWNSTDAITSLTLASESASNLKTGTLKLYGVS